MVRFAAAAAALFLVQRYKKSVRLARKTPKTRKKSSRKTDKIIARAAPKY